MGNNNTELLDSIELLGGDANDVIDACLSDGAVDDIIESIADSVVDDTAQKESENIPLPSRKDYENLIFGVFKDFYDEDVKCAKEIARTEERKLFDEQKENIIREAQRELIAKIRAKNQRISEIGTMKSHGNAKRNVSDMTKEERAAVAKRAASGEIINLK